MIYLKAIDLKDDFSSFVDHLIKDALHISVFRYG